MCSAGGRQRPTPASAPTPDLLLIATARVGPSTAISVAKQEQTSQRAFGAGIGGRVLDPRHSSATGHVVPYVLLTNTFNAAFAEELQVLRLSPHALIPIGVLVAPGLTHVVPHFSGAGAAAWPPLVRRRRRALNVASQNLNQGELEEKTSRW